MKLFCAWVALAAITAFAGVNPQLHEVKRVYILAMSASMDQFLASQLVKAGIFEVVTDPKKADAIITDRVGESLENKLDDLYPPPPAPKAKKEKESDETKPAADSTSETPKTEPPRVCPGHQQRQTGGSGSDRRRPAHTMGHGKGNIFIVSRGSRAVLWSTYEPPKNNTSRELTRTAERVVKHLQEDLTGKKPVVEQ